MKINAEPLLIFSDFYSMRGKKWSEIFILIMVPIIIAVIAFFIGSFMDLSSIKGCDFANDFFGQLITVIALFISFSIAYLGMVSSSNSETIKKMHEKDSEYYFLNNNPVKVFQVVHNMITYSILFEMLFLLILFAEKFFIYAVNLLAIKIMICLDLAIFIHIIIIMSFQIKDLYFIFWKP